MANLSRFPETVQWIHEAQVAGWDRLPESHPLSIAHVAREQRENLEIAKLQATSRGTPPSWCSLQEYEVSVQLLELVARSGRI